MNLSLAFGVIEKANWPMSFEADGMSVSDRAIGQHVTAYMGCAMQVDAYMRRHHPDEITMMIAEDNSQSRALIKATQNDFRNPKYIEEFDEIERKHFPFRKIKHSPLFEDKDQSVALQMADFCAYVVKRHAMDDKRYQSLFKKLHPCFAVHSIS